MKTPKLQSLLILMTFILAGPGCKKEINESAGKGSVDIRLTDNAGSYEKVLIDLQGVRLKIDGQGWTKVELTRPGIYNMLDFTHGIDTLLASSDIPAGNISEVMLVIGVQNSVISNGREWLLDRLSEDERGLRIKVNHLVLNKTHHTLWIDFDVAKSIRAYEGGGFGLTPVLRCYNDKYTGSVKGNVDPDNSANYGYLVPQNNVADTFLTLLKGDGSFRILGVKPGMYTVGFMNQNKNPIHIMNSVEVKANEQTDLGNILIP